METERRLKRRLGMMDISSGEEMGRVGIDRRGSEEEHSLARQGPLSLDHQWFRKSHKP